MQCQRHQTRQQHGAVGRENMPITGLPWQLHIWVTRIYRMAIADVSVPLSELLPVQCMTTWQSIRSKHVKTATTLRSCINLRVSRCFKSEPPNAAPGHDEMCRSVQYVQVGCPIVSLSTVQDRSGPFSVPCQQDLWTITSKCLGVWA